MAATVGQLAVNLIAKTAPLVKGLKRARRAIGSFAASAMQYGKVIGTVVGGAVIGLGAWAIKTASQFESIHTALQVMLGDAEQATKLMTELQTLSAKTPFQFADIATGARSLLAFGTEAERVVPLMQMLGDVAAGSSTNISEVVQIYGKMQATGRATLENINELSLRQVPIWKVLQSQTGKTAEEIRKMASVGELSFDMMHDAIQSMTVEGGIFYGAMDQQSKTLAGLWSTMKDNLALLANELGQRLIPFAKAFVGVATEWVQSGKNIAQSFDWVRKSIAVVLDTVHVLKIGWLGLNAAWQTGTFMIIQALANLAKNLEYIINLIPGVEVKFTGFTDAWAQNMEATARDARKKFTAVMAAPWPSAQVDKFIDDMTDKSTAAARKSVEAKPTAQAMKIPEWVGSALWEGLRGAGGMLKGMTAAGAIGTGKEMTQTNAALAERGSSEAYKAILGHQAPIAKLNETEKKALKELKVQTSIFSKVGEALAKGAGAVTDVIPG